jgi:hypothetical protein
MAQDRKLLNLPAALLRIFSEPNNNQMIWTKLPVGYSLSTIACIRTGK